MSLTTKGLIEWDTILSAIVPKSGDHNTVTSVVDRSSAIDDSPLLKSYQQVIKTWNDADYDLKNIEWWDYYPGQHFDIKVQEQFSDLVNADPRRVFVSEVFPGCNVPYHWDVEDKEEEWIAVGDELIRYVCFIDRPQFGHVLILDQECFYNVEQHTVHKWSSYKNYHAGTNCGVRPYYLFHFLGARRK
jgi:hypothetical protein